MSDRPSIASLDAQFSAMAERVERLDFTIDPTKPESLLHTQDALARIISDLQKLQSAETHLPEYPTPEGRRPLRDEIGELLEQTVVLYRQLTTSIMTAVTKAKAARNGTADSTSASTSTNEINYDEGNDDYDEDEDSSDEKDHAGVAPGPSPELARPLQRDEISRLLLLVTRAFAHKHLDDTEKALLKFDIVQRKSYLRVIMAQSNLQDVMQTLKLVAGRLMQLTQQQQQRT